MKQFTFDDAGNMTVTERTPGKDGQGNAIECVTQHDIQASQIERHFPMFKASMTTAEKEEAAVIIAGQKGE